MDIKEAYHKKAAAQLQEWQGWIDSFRKEEHQRAVERLEDCHRIARVRLEELSESRNERWELAKQAVERAMIELKRALDESGASGERRVIHLKTDRMQIYEESFARKG